MKGILTTIKIFKGGRERRRDADEVHNTPG